MIDPKDERLKVGAWVLYRPARVDLPDPFDPFGRRVLAAVAAPPEDGTISSLQALDRGMVHVRFDHSEHGKACYLRDLNWPLEAKVATLEPVEPVKEPARGKRKAKKRGELAAPNPPTGERLTGAAIRVEGRVFSVQQGTHQCARRAAKEAGVSLDRLDREEGFVTTQGRFVDRAEAGRIAFAADQLHLRPREAPMYLTSQDVRW